MKRKDLLQLTHDCIYQYIIEYSFRVIAIAAQSFVEDILTGTAESINCKKKNNKFLEWKELSEILKEKGLTQKDLAKMLHKRDSEISKWLTGRHNFTTQTIARIQSALGCNIISIAR